MLSNKSNILKYALAILSIFVASISFATTTITSKVDSKNKLSSEPIELQISVKSNKSSVDLDYLQGLEELNRKFKILSSSKSVSRRFINGNSSYSSTLSLVIFPKNSSLKSISIPSFTYKGHTSREIEINFSTRSNKIIKNELLIDVSVSKTKVYVGQPIYYDVNIKTSLPLKNGSIEPLNIPQTFEIDLGQQNGTTYIQGNLYETLTLSTAIFSAQKQRLKIPKRAFTANLLIGRNKINSFFSMPNLKQITKIAPSAIIDVLPHPKLPNNYKHWIPSDSILLKDSWSDTSYVKQGDLVTRTITVEFYGVFSTQIPENLLEDYGQKNTQAYPQKPTITQDSKIKLKTTWTQKINYLISESGEISFKENKIIWWDNKKNKFKTLIVPSKKIFALKQQKQSNQNNQNNIPDTQKKQHSDKKQKKKQEKEEEKNEISILNKIKTPLLYAFYAIVVAIALLSIVALIRRKIRIWKSNKAENNKKKEIYKKELAEIRKSLKNNDPITTKNLLLLWGNAYWKSEPKQKIISLNDLANMANKSIKNTNDILVMLELITELKKLYDKDNSIEIAVYETKLPQILEASLIAKKQQKQISKQKQLPPLYPK